MANTQRKLKQRGLGGRPTLYDPDIHPALLVRHFKAALDAVEEVERVVTDSGSVRWVQKPAPPPTLAGFAAKVGVCRDTLHEWAQKHEEFREAVGLAKAYQEDVFTRMALLGAYPANAAVFVLKNLLDWVDKIEERHVGGAPIVLRFDRNDEKL